MKRLILGRHSIAANHSSSGKDFDRRLTSAGVEFANSQASQLNQKKYTIDQLYSSDAQRARQTAEIYNEFFKSTEIAFDNFLYEDYTTQDFINFIGSFSNDIESTMIVGHNPNIAAMASRLVSNFHFPVKPGTIIIIDFDLTAWNAIEVGKGKLVEVF